MKIAIVYCTYSASGKGKKLSHLLSDELNKAKINNTLFENNWPKDFTGFNYLCLVGGDGTVNYFLNQYPKITTPIFIVPGGTGNDFFWSIYGKVKAKNQIKAIANALSHNKINAACVIDVATCKTDDNKVLYFVNSVGLGFDGEVLKSMKSIRVLGGHLGYLMVVIKTIFKFKEPHYTIEFDGQTIQQKSIIINIANSPSTGGGFLISPHAKNEDETLNLLYCSAPKVGTRLKLLNSVEKGKHLNSSLVNYTPTKQVKVSTNQKIFSQIDGELIQSASYEIGLAEWKFPIIKI